MQFWTTIGLIFVLSALGLTYEIAAGRLLAPFFGTSLLTWTSVIATVLAGFSLGSALGGFVAEREPPAAVRAVRMALVATAVLIALSPMVLALLYSLGARGTGGMLISVVIAFFPASVCVTLPSPYLAKRAIEARPGRAGSSLGIVLAAGSLGAILGAILAGFVTLPLVGSAATFAGCGLVALLCVPVVRDAAGGAVQRGQGPILAIGPAALIVAVSALGGSPCRYESGLSCIDVARVDGATRLYADRVEQAAERRLPGDTARGAAPGLVLPYTQWIWDRMAQDLGPDPRVLFIGGGGYSLPGRLVAARPQARAVVVEIDPLVTQVVRDRMPLAGAILAREGHDATLGARTDRRLGIVHADGRVFLNQTDQRFDAAVMDAFSSGSVPAHLATREAYERLRALVDGPVYVNLIDRPDGPLARGLHAILRDLYAYVDVVQGPVSPRGRRNYVLAASATPPGAPTALPEGYGPVSIGPGRAFTDDRGWVGHR